MASTSGIGAEAQAALAATAATLGDEAAASLISNLRIDEKHTEAAGAAGSSAEAGPSSASARPEADDGLGDIGADISSRPTVLILIGMAGAGKTTLANRLIATLMAEGRAPYVVNLDPACGDPPYPVNIDIRDTVDYKKVMENYSLGPNGAIVTSLNLFSTKFDQVIRLILQKPLKSNDFVIVDTPGQIEVFMWSASGQIILQSLAARFRSTVLYVTDLTNNLNPITFISNMTYGLSILYKCRLPMVIALNKCDKTVKDEGGQIISATTNPEKWMEDFEAYQAALNKHEGYAANLAASLCLSLDDFYSKIGHLSVSATTGQGIAALFIKLAEAVVEYEKIFLPEFKREMAARDKKLADASGAPKHKQELKDLAKSMTRAVGPSKKTKYDQDQEAEMFSVTATAATAQGFSLTMGMGLDDEDDDTSDSDDEEVRREESDDNEEDKESFRQFYDREVLKKKGIKPDK